MKYARYQQSLDAKQNHTQKNPPPAAKPPGMNSVRLNHNPRQFNIIGDEASEIIVAYGSAGS